MQPLTCVVVLQHNLDNDVAVQLVRVVVLVPTAPVLVRPLHGQQGPSLSRLTALEVFLVGGETREEDEGGGWRCK